MNGPSRSLANDLPLHAPDLPQALGARILHPATTMVVLSFSLSRCAALTAAELDVARFAGAGMSNRDIAYVRRTSIRTVANQIASVFRKLGVASRAELATIPEVLA
jgi:DNA-binding CsgD family transcriptional regulator